MIGILVVEIFDRKTDITPHSAKIYKMSDKENDFGTHFYVVKKNSKKPEKVRLNWKMRKRKNRTKFEPKNNGVNAKREGFEKIKI